jgi:hypothetical protein
MLPLAKAKKRQAALISPGEADRIRAAQEKIRAFLK